MPDRYFARSFSILVLCTCVVATAVPALALDCSSADTLACGVTSASYKLKNGVTTTGTLCTTPGYDLAIVFVVVVDTVTQITFTANSTPGGSIDLYLLASCDESACVAGTTGGLSGAPLVADCVNPGTYYLAAVSLTAANATIDLTSACSTCTITPVEEATWGRLKARYH